MNQPKRRKPREWWVVVNRDGDLMMSRNPATGEMDADWTRAKARMVATEANRVGRGLHPCKAIHVREVPKPAARKGRKR